MWRASRSRCRQRVEPPSDAVGKRARPLQAEDFRRVLGTPPFGRSEHFALHFTPPSAAVAVRPQQHADADLSTPMNPTRPGPVEQASRLGFVVPKRLARRAVTRNLIRRQGRAIWTGSSAAGRPGDWVIRQNRPFDPTAFSSAKSQHLRLAVRLELQKLLDRVLAAMERR